MEEMGVDVLKDDFEDEPNEEISMFVAGASILKRMIPSVVIIAAGNKVLVKTKKAIRKIWES